MPSKARLNLSAQSSTALALGPKACLAHGGKSGERHVTGCQEREAVSEILVKLTLVTPWPGMEHVAISTCKRSWARGFLTSRVEE